MQSLEDQLIEAMTNNDIEKVTAISDELHKNPVELIPELQAGLSDGNDCYKIPGIYTKFFHTPFVPPQLYGKANVAYKLGEINAKEALEKQNYEKFVFTHEKPYRMEAFFRVMPDVILNKSPKYFFELFLEVWVNIENIWQYKDELLAPLIVLKRPDYDEFRFDEDVELEEDEHGYITVYRGYCEYQGDGEDGYSFTTSLEKAKWFSNRLSNYPAVIKRKVKREDIIFTTNSRGEYEVVLMPE